MEVATGWHRQHMCLLFFLEAEAYSDKNGTQPGEIAFT
jgi:hypothetical protein